MNGDHYCEAGRCTQIGEPHHIILRGLGGCDCSENIIWLCRIHHTMAHLKTIFFIAKFCLQEAWWIAEEHFKDCQYKFKRTKKYKSGEGR